MQTTEVTQGQWQKIMGSNPSGFPKGDDYPVETISWHQAHHFIDKINEQNKGPFHFRLPTDAEWEYACRSGGKQERFAGGNNVDTLGWYTQNSGYATHPVGGKSPNGLGLLDMSGNVFEWCQDWYASDAYRSHEQMNPVYSVAGSLRVVRGGSWGDDKKRLRCTARSTGKPEKGNEVVGLRLVKTELPAEKHE